MSLGDVNGVRATSVRVEVPPEGLWTADATLEVDTAVASRATLTLADLVLVGTLASSAEHVGARSLRIEAGGGGWQKILGPKFYRHALGVKVSTVLGDAAREAGEELELLGDDRVLGEFFVRLGGRPASRLLRALGASWYVGTDGRTRVGSRPAGVVTAHVDVLSFDGATGRALLATEALAQIVPGWTITAPTLGTRTIRSAIHTLSGSELRTEALLA